MFSFQNIKVEEIFDLVNSKTTAFWCAYFYDYLSYNCYQSMFYAI